MIKKSIPIFILSFSFIVCSLMTPVTYAENFKGNENKYIKLCSSSKLTSSQQKTCKSFNTYLANKNKELNEQATESKKDIKETKLSLENIEKKLAETSKKITHAKKELNYVNNTITKLNKQIKNKKETLRDRLYAMQTSLNSSMFITYLYNATDITDFFRRLSQIKDITAYENQLVKELNASLKEVSKQKKTVVLLNTSLKNEEANQKSLQKKYLAQLEKEKGLIISANQAIEKNKESMESITKNLAAIKKASDESKVNNVTSATPNKKPTNNNTNTNTNTNANTNTNNDNPSNTLSGDEKLGLKIANKALTRQGYMYVWGGCHSTTALKNPNQTQFDCSGLVCWAHYQCGVNIGVQSTKYNLATYGKTISKSNIQAGDIILFSDNGAFSGVHHVGIYIGNNQMVHAPATGKPVQVANLNTSYWQKEWYTVRRCY